MSEEILEDEEAVWKESQMFSLRQLLRQHEERFESLLLQHQKGLLEALKINSLRSNGRCAEALSMEDQCSEVLPPGIVAEAAPPAQAERPGSRLSFCSDMSLEPVLDEPAPAAGSWPAGEKAGLPRGAQARLRAAAATNGNASDEPADSGDESAECRPTVLMPQGSARGNRAFRSSGRTSRVSAVRRRSEAPQLRKFADKEAVLQNAEDFDDEKEAEHLVLHRSFVRTYAEEVVKHKCFEIVMVLLILGNSICVGIQADLLVKRNGASVPSTMQNLDYFFTGAFTLELIIRLLAQGIEYYRPNTRWFYWNVLDTFIVASALVDVVIQQASVKARASATGVMRLLRVMRIIRVLRVLRVIRFFQDLRILVCCIGASIKSLMWALLLSLMIAFVVGVCIMDFIGAELGRQAVSLTEEMELRKWYGSLSRTLYSLYKATTGGESWGDMSDPLIQVHSFLGLLFCLYIAIAVLCVLNIITGMFVENAKKMTAQDETQFIMDNVAARKLRLEEVRELFLRVADPRTQELNSRGFAKAVSDVRVQACFKRFGLDIEQESVAGLFELLDFQGDGVIDLDEFTLGIQLLHGSAKSIDMAKVRYGISTLNKQVAEIFDILTGEMVTSGSVEGNIVEHVE